jgi:hypothetical protein
VGEDIARVFGAVVAICDAEGLIGRDVRHRRGEAPEQCVKRRRGRGPTLSARPRSSGHRADDSARHPFRCPAHGTHARCERGETYRAPRKGRRADSRVAGGESRGPSRAERGDPQEQPHRQ